MKARTSSTRSKRKAGSAASSKRGWRQFGHRADLYARRVLGDRSAGVIIVAGPLVRLACTRHLKDRRRRDLVFDVAKADHVLAFFEKYLRLLDTKDETGAPKLFLLSPWQAFILAALFGWQRLDGTRRFRRAYIEIGKGAGKTPMAAGIGLYGLMSDGENAAEIYAAAVDRGQAAILFKDAERMVDVSPELTKRLHRTPAGEPKGTGNISYRKTSSFFRPFSREQGLRSGPRPHMALIDEVHEHHSAEVISKISAGVKFRKQPLVVEITEQRVRPHVDLLAAPSAFGTGGPGHREGRSVVRVRLRA